MQASTDRRRAPWWLAALLLIPLTALAAGASYLTATLYWSPERILQENWAVQIPSGVRSVEHHSEPSFHGDGFRLTVLEARPDARLAGTFFDPGQMSTDPLTPDQVALIDAVQQEYRAQHPIDFAQSAVRVAELRKHNDRLLCLYDESTGLFHIYEDLL